MSKSQEHKQKLYNQLNICEKVRRTVNSKGWSEILGPKLQKMIDSVCGQRDKDNVYVRGMIDMEKGHETFYLGYKAGLMDFNNEVYHHLASIKKTKDSLIIIEKQGDKAQTHTKPMEDTQYAGGEGQA